MSVPAHRDEMGMSQRCTERDAGWTSFSPTPMHPEYPSQAAAQRAIPPPR